MQVADASCGGRWGEMGRGDSGGVHLRSCPTCRWLPPRAWRSNVEEVVVVMRSKTAGLKEDTHHEEVERPLSPSEESVSRWARGDFSAGATAYKWSNAFPGARAKHLPTLPSDEIWRLDHRVGAQRPHLLPFAPRAARACRCESKREHSHTHWIIRPGTKIRLQGGQKEAARDFR